MALSAGLARLTTSSLEKLSGSFISHSALASQLSASELLLEASDDGFWRYLTTLRSTIVPTTSTSFTSTFQLNPTTSSGPHQLRSFHTTPTPSMVKVLVPQTITAPKPLPKFKKLPRNLEDTKWRRMVLRFPPEVDTKLQGSNLVLSGRAGTVKVNLKHMDPTGTVGMQFFQQTVTTDGKPVTHTLMMCVSPTRQYFRGIATHIDNQIHGVLQGYLEGITLKGVGYRFEPVEEEFKSSKPFFDTTPQEKVSVNYPVQKALRAVRLKVGYSFTKIVPLPEDLRAFIVRPTLMYVFGLERHRVRNLAMHIRDVQPPNPFTGNGIRLVNEEVKLRPRGGK